MRIFSNMNWWDHVSSFQIAKISFHGKFDSMNWAVQRRERITYEHFISDSYTFDNHLSPAIVLFLGPCACFHCCPPEHTTARGAIMWRCQKERGWTICHSYSPWWGFHKPSFRRIETILKGNKCRLFVVRGTDLTARRVGAANHD